MPWCPKCRNEYVETATRCPDCQVGLVDDLAAHDHAEAQAQSQRRLRIEGPAEALESLAASLTRAQVEVVRSEGGLDVPLALAEQIESALIPSMEFDREGAILRILGPRADREPTYELDPTLFKVPMAELVLEPERTLPRLVAALAVGTPRQRGFALSVLREFESTGRLTVADFVLRLAQQGWRTPLFALVNVLSDSPHPAVATRLAQELSRISGPALVLALHVLAQLADPSVARSVLPLLDHDHPDVRAEADEVLMSVAGRDMGFDAEAEPPIRAAVVQRWREWVDGAIGA